MNTLNYKGFIGAFNYAEEDDILFGKIEGVTDLVTFQGASIQEVKKAFTEAVEDYIILCDEVGKEPMKSFKGSFNVRLTPQLHRQITLEAVKNNMNLNQFIQKTLEKVVLLH